MPQVLDLSRLHSEPLPATLKGLAARAVGQPLAALGSLGLSMLDGDLPFPVAVLKESALAHNIEWMRAFVQRAGVELCPHGKTTMAPQLFDRQLRAGCWGITAATASHVRTYRQFGVQRVILANQLIARANIDLVFDELDADPAFDFYCLVDSLDGLHRLQQHLHKRPLARPLQVLLEAGSAAGRTGVRSFEEGQALGRALRDAAPKIALRGIEAFEGVFGGSDHAGIELSVLALLDTVAGLASTGLDEQWFAPGDVILTAGGSAFFDLVTQVLDATRGRSNVRIVLRSGCYLTHDVLGYERMHERMRQRSPRSFGTGAGLRAALEVWSVVQSVPEPQRAICALGKRDVSYDLELPRLLYWFRPGQHTSPQLMTQDLRVVALNDQHAYVDSIKGDVGLQVGDLVGFGPSHPCTTFDKWPLLYTVDDCYGVVGGIRTFF